MAKFELNREKKQTKEIDDVLNTMTDKMNDYSSTFKFLEYGIIEEKEINFLIEAEQQIFVFGNNFNKALFDFGKLLTDVKETFSNKKERGFQVWYENLGLNKDFVSRVTKRYSLFLKDITKKDIVYNLSESVIKQVSNKNIPKEIVEKVLNGEIKTTKEIKEVKNLFSPAGENKFFEKKIEILNLKDELMEKLKELLIKIKKENISEETLIMLINKIKEIEEIV